MESMNFTGFSISLQTASDNQGYSYILFFQNNLQNPSKVGKVQFRGRETPIHFKVIRNENKITMLQIEGDDITTKRTTQTIFTKTIDDMPDYGYFSFFAQAYDPSENVDIYSVQVTQTSAESTTIPPDTSRKNRKIIEDFVDFRRLEKSNRRQYMPSSIKYQIQSKNTNGTLTPGATDLHDAFKIIHEAIYRSTDSITVSQFKKFVLTYIKKEIQSSAHKMEEAFKSFDDISMQIFVMWSNLKYELQQIATTADREMLQLKHDALDLAKKIDFKKIDFDGNTFQMGTSYRERSFSWVLAIISIAEIVGYIIFFIMQHHKTKGFKKID
ncbi:Legume-like lectin family protein [Histomonas meleagridis]|uniref:Legume-like lectin family protein n=1 Tax=Histomonas meleagridis TaxID=135588 RepID=UPI0035599C23|nr:Legume-like lectin family protein [Histomonas meleagridis]KAH0805543.1 Legume-like lectin family protein [Histomonas meleagridis]